MSDNQILYNIVNHFIPHHNKLNNMEVQTSSILKHYNELVSTLNERELIPVVSHEHDINLLNTTLINDNIIKPLSELIMKDKVYTVKDILDVHKDFGNLSQHNQTTLLDNLTYDTLIRCKFIPIYNEIDFILDKLMIEFYGKDNVLVLGLELVNEYENEILIYINMCYLLLNLFLHNYVSVKDTYIMINKKDNTKFSDSPIKNIVTDKQKKTFINLVTNIISLDVNLGTIDLNLNNHTIHTIQEDILEPIINNIIINSSYMKYSIDEYGYWLNKSKFEQDKIIQSNKDNIRKFTSYKLNFTESQSLIIELYTEDEVVFTYTYEDIFSGGVMLIYLNLCIYLINMFSLVTHDRNLIPDNIHSNTSSLLLIKDNK